MGFMRKSAVSLSFVLLMGCATARPPDLKRTLQDGSIDLVVQKMLRPWRIIEKAGVEGIQLESDRDDLISLRLYSAQKMDPFMAAFGALMFFSERFPGSNLDSEQKRDQPAYTRGRLVVPDKPPIHLEVRAWKVPGTETVAVVTGMWPDDDDPTRLQDFEAVCGGIHATTKKR
jgi:hypothetical protein